MRIKLLVIGLLLIAGVGRADLTSNSIKRVYMVVHAHLDIGFDKPPEAMADAYLGIINTQVGYANNATRPDYRWTVEETWQLEQFLKRSTPTQIKNLLKAVVSNEQIRVAGGFGTLHSAKAGAEVVNRLLWNTARYRNLYGFKIETVFNDDVPAASWSYPQVLAKSGIKYLVMGENMFIGGGISQPWKSYIFRWEGPDGSRVLTWSAQNSYMEGVWIFTKPLNEANLTTTLTNLTSAGYPYDAVMIQTALDNNSDTAVYYSSATNWNATHTNPKIIIATAEDFFEYMEGKYAADIPVRRGNWISNWDTSGLIGPNEIKIAKNGQNLLPVAEQMNALAADRGVGGYDSALFTAGWDQVLEIYEHAGPGPCWANYFTQAELDTNNWEYRQYALEALNVTTGTLASGVNNLLDATAISNSDCIVVYNPLSWTRTDLARIPLTPALLAEDFTLRDAITGLNVVYQKEPSVSSVLFVARDVPPVGFKRYRIEHAPAPAVTNTLTVGTRTNENTRFRITVDNWGYVSGIYDKTANRQVVDTNDAFQFNRMIEGTNTQWFYGQSSIVSNSASPPVITISRSGPVATSLRVARNSHPHAGAEITLYDGLDRIDIVNTPDRSNMLYVVLAGNSRYYGLTFPFNLINAEARIDTAAGWCNPRTDLLAGSYKYAFGIQNGLDLSEANYGITFATPDVPIHAFGGFQGNGTFPPSNPTIVSTFIRYADEADVDKTTNPGRVTDEPGASNRWDLSYSIRPHMRGFDAVADARFGWEVCSPLQGKVVPARTNGVLPGNALAFFAVDLPNVLITSIKKADFGTGLIVKLQEIAGVSSNRVTLSSDAFGYSRVQSVTPLEADTGLPLLSTSASNRAPRQVRFTMGSREIASLRIITAPLAPPLPSVLMFSARNTGLVSAPQMMSVPQEPP